MTPDVSTPPNREDGAASPEIDLDHLDDFEDLLDLEAASSESPPLSPSLAGIVAPISPFYSRANAVHMEVQENAKLPTLNFSVDRTNSSLPRLGTVSVYSPDTRRDIDEMMRLSEQDFSLTEVFLKSNQRSSRNMNYSSAGALMSSIGNRISDGGHDMCLPNLDLQTKMSQDSGATTNNSNPADLISSALTTSPSLVTTSQEQSRYAYGRPFQLPIPRNVEPKELTIPMVPATIMSDVLTIAAAAAAAADSEVEDPASPPLIPGPAMPKPAPHRPAYAPPLPGAAAPSYYQNASHAKAQATPTASIVEATLRRSQFGFGENHVVPSTVQPPTAKKKSKVPPQLPPSPVTLNSGAAYERKKQRAKDSRVKLNEAIDNLSIAINLAGSQSKQRAAQLQALPTLHQDRQKTIESMNAAANTAESAKKWERPSFVNTSATLVQNLNTQCEALMREVLRLQDEAVTLPKSEAVLSPDLKRRDDEHEVQLSAKRQKVVTPSDAPLWEKGPPPDPVFDVFSQKASVLAIAKFLDPLSLLRCQQISRTVRDLDAFQDDSVWLQSSLIARFGMFNVRQWRDLLEESTSVLLYQKMDSANVRPHSPEEGSLFLGEGRMPGKVSAWVSMVERSNGETCRSVQIEGKSEYTSLPVVELRYLIQNTGYSEIVVKDQVFGVDASTRRRGDEWKEINWDDRFQKTLLNLDGSPWPTRSTNDSDLCKLKLYESVIVVVHVQAKGCSTTSKFQQRANFTKLLVNLAGTTLPLVVPFFRDGN
jgi:hypothetical protein